MGDRATSWLPPADWVPALSARHPEFAEGIARIGDVIAEDGAVPKPYKMLFIATIAAVKRDRELVAHFLRIALESGLPRDQAESAAVGVLISRGVVPHQLLTESIAAHYGEAVEASPGGDSTEVDDLDVDASKAYFEQYFGFIPDYIELLANAAPKALEGYTLMRKVALDGTAMPSKYMELLLCAVNAAEYQTRFVMIHARGARRSGATESELVESCLTALPFAGVASWLPAADGIIQSRTDS
ncbi:carboxymuconolactone decarboxylase family protein (plasmid) [Rhodococcus sp. ZPP]|uniref:carboxymuconolactone decarboxylase family protein n=1 Tax=Rhodococcus sp. ZPP TaxID=2749906 RepID=UPI001AD85808|nr:carboxymuconolactone decarboxylase family protein [Rhodococcus sp. ZPP]QTJ70252.1 carboxymuconolactone decarboxylase family protein [Rhodococcus sp. ZPP]